MCDRGCARFAFTFNWKIENFTMGMLSRNEWLYSPLLALPLTKARWKIMLHPHFGSKKCVAIFLKRVSSKSDVNKICRFYATLSLLNIDNSDAKFIKSSNILKFDYLGSKEFISWNYLLDNKHVILPKDSLTIQCEIYVLVFVHTLNLFSFLEDINNLYQQEEKDLRFLSSEECNTFDSMCKNNVMENTDTQDTEQTDPRNTENVLLTAISNFFKNLKRPVLHAWFQYLYSENYFKFLDTNFKEAVLQDSNRWPRGVPTKWLLRSFLETKGTFFTWNIKDFSRLDLDEKCLSPTFRCGATGWKLMFYLSRDNAGKEIAEIFVCPIFLNFIRKTVMKCRISVVTRDGRMPVSEEQVHLCHNDSQWRFPSFIRKQTLNENKELYLANDILCLYCTFSLSDAKYEGEVTETDFDSEYIDFCGLWRLSEDMLGLLESGRYSDVKLKAGHLEIPAHRSILAERSSALRREMKSVNLKSDWVLDMQSVLDCDGNMESLLNSIYGAWDSSLTDSTVSNISRSYDVSELCIEYEDESDS